MPIEMVALLVCNSKREERLGFSSLEITPNNTGLFVLNARLEDQKSFAYQMPCDMAVPFLPNRQLQKACRVGCHQTIVLIHPLAGISTPGVEDHL